MSREEAGKMTLRGSGSAFWLEGVGRSRVEGHAASVDECDYDIMQKGRQGAEVEVFKTLNPQP